MPRKSGAPIDAYTESGSKRVFAGAIEWPGWCRSAPDEARALAALVAYAPRYAGAMKGTRLGFRLPAGEPSELTVTQRLKGDATTDFGAPSIAPHADDRAVDAQELRRLQRILRACWASFDRVGDAADGTPLRKGPRGGGRDLDAIVAHVVGAESGYVRMLAARSRTVDEVNARAVADEVRHVVLDALSRAVTDGLPAAGPRGGKIWKPRYFVRRTAWHVLDHAWEIEDRSTTPS